MSKNLLIVESPAKAKTIEKILGKDFQVKSSYGHVRDLEKNDMGVDVSNNFTPKYIVPDDKLKVVNELKSLAKKADEVWLASDEDREGESISWHLAEVLNLDPKTTKRIVFHEITAPAIKHAVANPRTIDMNLVNAQQARRVVDRLVGFELSPVLWRKIGRTGGLSAGRVQSVAVKLIVEREREINKFTAEVYYKVEAIFVVTEKSGKQSSFKAEGKKFNTEAEAHTFLESCINATYKVGDIQVKPAKRTPAAPFTTSTLQQEAARKLGYSVSKTMMYAQRLYESGKITYMRTDSVNLSNEALKNIGDEIDKKYGVKYHHLRKYKTKNSSAQEAHEAIRPTYISHESVADHELNRLYQLIWKRTIASQMSDAELEKTTVSIDVTEADKKTLPGFFTSIGEVIKFDGFLKVYMEGSDDEENADDPDDERLPKLTIGEPLQLDKMWATEKFSRPPARYTEASLVKKLEDLSIGRPSTYAPTISTIIKRNYVEKGDKSGVERPYKVLTLKNNKINTKDHTELVGSDKGKLVPTDLGFVVTDFLNKNFAQVMDYNFTANIEQEFDEIADGKMIWNRMVNDFYSSFHTEVAHTMENAERASGERYLGENAEGKAVTTRMGKYGPMVQVGSSGSDGEDAKPQYAPLKPGQSIETITLDEALDLFKLPLSLGPYLGQDVQVNIGRFGPYVKWNEQYVSLPKGTDVFDVDLNDAITFIEEKQQQDAPVATYENLPVTKGKGRFGPFIKWNGMFINVPRAYDFDNLSQQDIDELIEKKVQKEANRFIKTWPDDKISIENGRWGPFIRYNKKMYNISKKAADGAKLTAEDLAHVTVDEVKQMITDVDPTAFASKKTTKKTTAVKKPGTTAKTTAKKTATKPKSTVKAAAAAKRSISKK